MPRALRTMSCVPTSYSRSLICRLRDGCAVCSRRSAATVRLPSSATAMKYRRCRSSIVQPMPARYGTQPTKSFSSAPEDPRLSSGERSPAPLRMARMLVRPAISWRNRAMSNPVVLITGALTGIGRATAIAFAKEGARLVVAGRHEDAGQQLTTELRALGAEAEFIRADVRHEDEVRDLVDRTVARFGRLDVAVNNAATEGQVGPITDQTAA